LTIRYKAQTVKLKPVSDSEDRSDQMDVYAGSVKQSKTKFTRPPSPLLLRYSFDGGVAEDDGLVRVRRMGQGIEILCSRPVPPPRGTSPHMGPHAVMTAEGSRQQRIFFRDRTCWLLNGRRSLLVCSNVTQSQ
jgi:hypothetical protein